MRILVLGAGAVGSFLGWAVARGGGDTILVRRGHDGGANSRRPLTVVDPAGRMSTVEVGVVGGVGGVVAAPPDVVIVAVRQYDLPAALEALRALPRTAVLTAQNGVGAEESAQSVRPAGPLLAASVTASVDRDPDGTVRWLRRGGVGLAAVRGEADAVLEPLASALRAADMPVRRYGVAAAMKWSKLVANLVANATSGILDVDPRDIYADPRLFEVERAQLREALAVMRAQRLRPVDLPGAPVRLLALATVLPAPLSRAAFRRVVGSARGGKDPSLRGAVRLGGNTEVGWLNGAVERAGAVHGVSTPVNSALARLVMEASGDEDRRAWFRRRPDRLLAEIGSR